MQQEYIGGELDLFEKAQKWKRYWFEMIEPYIGRKVLDVGAGIGSTANLLSDKKIHDYLAIEPDENNINILKEKASLGLFNVSFRYINGNIENLGKDDVFDTILYIDVLEHISDDRKELKTVSNHLLPGGRLVIISPAHQWLFSLFDQSIGHYRRYNKKRLISVKPDNLRIEQICYLDSVGIFASAANRLLLRNTYPTEKQIKVWNDYMVPVSRLIDKITMYSLGKTILGVFQLPK